MRSPRLAALAFTLTAAEPITVGDPHGAKVADRIDNALAPSGSKEMLVDIPIATDPWQSPVVRGTSVMGALRSHLMAYELKSARPLTFQGIQSRGRVAHSTRAATLADLLCGSEPEELAEPPAPGTRALAPSALRMVSCQVSGSRDPGRTRTAISRREGAAVARKLFRRAELRDAKIALLAAVDLDILTTRLGDLLITSADPTIAAVDDLITALMDWRPRVGGRVGTGYGSLTIDDVRYGSADPLDPATLLAADTTITLLTGLLRHHGARTALHLAAAPATGDDWSLTVPLRCDDPLLLAPEKDPNRGNHATTSGSLWGSSWRGILRSRSEFILRSCGVHACESTTKTCGQCATCRLFGWTPEATSRDDRVGARGLVRFPDSTVTGVKLRLDHAPVDRFTGGAADEKLFTRDSWAPGSTLTLEITQASPRRPVPEWGRHLITLALRDITDGYVGVGNSTTRGYGTLELADGAALPDVPNDWLVELIKSNKETS